MSEVKLRLIDLDESIRDNSEKGRVAAGIREGRRRQKQDQAQEALKAAATLAGVKEAHVAEIARLDGRWQREETKAVKGARAFGMFIGAIVGAALMLSGMLVTTIVGVDQLRAFGAGMVVAGAATRAASEPDAQERPPTTEAPRSESAGTQN